MVYDYDSMKNRDSFLKTQYIITQSKRFGNINVIIGETIIIDR